MQCKSFCRTLIFAMTGIFFAPQLCNAEVKAPINLTITGVGVEGYYKVVVESLSSILRNAYPGSAITFKPSSPAGGLQMLADGKADISLAAGAPEIEAALNGKPPFREPLKGKFTGLMQVLDGQYFMFIANKEWATKYGIKTLADIAKKKPPLQIAINRQGNMQIVDVAKDIFVAHGFSIADLPKWGGAVSWVASGVGLDQLADGKVDMFVNVRFVPDAVISKIASSRNLVWIEADKKKLEIVKERWAYPVDTIKKGTYDFLTDDVLTINQWSDAVVGSHVPLDTVQKVLKALADNATQMKAVHPSMKDFSVQSMAKVADFKLLPLNPAAEKFYEANGVLHK